MNPQDSRAASLSIPQPLAALAVAGSETLPQGNNLDEVTQRSKSEHPRSFSTENSSDRSHHSPGLKGNSENLLQLSTYLVVPGVPPTVTAFLNHGVVAPAEFKRLENGDCAVKTEGEGEVEDDRKKEREHKKRSKNWTRLETLNLIRARTDFDEKFRKTTGRKVALWDEIAQVLQGASFSRDAQQCKDKWEKLTAGYKEVKDGAKQREDHPFYEQLHQLLSRKTHRRDSVVLANSGDTTSVKVEFATGQVPSQKEAEAPYCAANGSTPVELRDDQREETSSPRKRRRVLEDTSLTDLAVVQDLLETVITRQQRFFKDLLEAMERKEQLREQIRHEREEKWRAEERAQRIAFSNAMMVLTQRLLGERPGAPPIRAPAVVAQPEGQVGPKKRSKNWKRTEVLQLIRFRREMDARFSKSTRRAGLWEELGERLVSLGIRRDGKQCREKWDKLMAEYKDVTDGRKEQDESPYFAELSAFLRKTMEEAEADVPQETPTKEEYTEL